jgi:hypothetical protein
MNSVDRTLLMRKTHGTEEHSYQLITFDQNHSVKTIGDILVKDGIEWVLFKIKRNSRGIKTFHFIKKQEDKQNGNT